ncbi:hypothetical protein D3H35_11095 [Cohnella faecalis]|uniref:Uncharacterized protein n=1 Tax=Cohnella faecalis TaxID=2315694 RepID=A0A398CM99_9BACL|nr:hypothetical protein D3H35_11095 [Cohnella faecalis]
MRQRVTEREERMRGEIAMCQRVTAREERVRGKIAMRQQVTTRHSSLFALAHARYVQVMSML